MLSNQPTNRHTKTPLYKEARVKVHPASVPVMTKHGCRQELQKTVTLITKAASIMLTAMSRRRTFSTTKHGERMIFESMHKHKQISAAVVKSNTFQTIKPKKKKAPITCYSCERLKTKSSFKLDGFSNNTCNKCCP